MRYYKAIVQMGHLGFFNTTEIPLFIKAKDILSAMKIAKRVPAVKHGRVPLNLQEITQEEYEEGRKQDLYKQFMDSQCGGAKGV